MKKYLSILSSCWLFRGLSEQEIETVLGCVSESRQSYDKHEFLFHAGDSITRAGIVLSGEVHIFREDFWGNHTILSNFTAGDLFAEVFAVLPEQCDVSACAVQPTEILYLKPNFMTACSAGCPFHSRLTMNYIRVLAQKNRRLSRKIHHLTQRSTREKLLSYLSDQQAACGTTVFQIPFNRQQLADYLSVDRSALSAELSRLQKAGILTYHKNTFTLLHPTEHMQ